jgi:hypothetical protein
LSTGFLASPLYLFSMAWPPFSPYSTARNGRSGWVGKISMTASGKPNSGDPPQGGARKIPLPESQVEGTKQACRHKAGGVFF